MNTTSNQLTQPKWRSDDGAEDLGSLAVGEFLAEDGDAIVVGILGFGTKFDFDLGVHHPCRLGEIEIADGILPGLANLNTDTLGEGTKLIPSHRLKGAESSGLKDVSGTCCVCCHRFHLLGTIYKEEVKSARYFLKNFLKSRDPKRRVFQVL